ncbi:MAG: L,D-transpeptidase, partial [Olegusella sp.]|nr:L,D-transpeptidase [Olegusella sp.]
VTYWMPFIGNDVGLHDASWRSQFGGSIYQYNGSHGCVNLPTDKAAQLYGLTRVGDKVIVHW